MCKTFFQSSLLTLVALAVASTPVLAQDVLYVAGDQVLIGDSTPVAGAKFVVKSATTGPTDAIYLENATGPARLNLRNLAQTDTATKNRVWTINSNGDLRFTAGTDGPEMRLDAAGNLTVLASVKVAGQTLNVPDFVFEPGYSPLPLDELGAFIQEHRHLPDVPSAADVAREGLDMTDMQMRILQKVEELTLYTLQQQELIDELQKTIDFLQDKSSQ